MHRMESSESVTSSLGTAFVKQSPSSPQPVHSSVNQPILIDNLKGAHLLTPLQSALGANQFLNAQLILPFTLCQSINGSVLLSKTCHSSPSAIVQLNINEIQNEEKRAQEMRDKQTDKAAISSLDIDPSPKTLLSTSDTLLLRPASFDTIAGLSYLVESASDSEHVVEDRNRLLVGSSSRGLSLLSNISDRSVSLESIPSGELFWPETHVSEMARCKSKSDLERVTDVGETTTTSCAHGPSTSDEVSVLGSNTVPESVMLLFKQICQRNHYNGPECLTELPVPELANHLMSPVQSQLDLVLNYHSALEISNSVQACSEKDPTDLQDFTEESLVARNSKKGLSRSDTVILDVAEGEPLIKSNYSELQKANTIILTSFNSNCEVAHSDERLSEGFSFASTNSSQSNSLETKVGLSSGQSMAPAETAQDSTINYSGLPLSLPAMQNSVLGRSLYLLTPDGHLTALRYITPNPLEAIHSHKLKSNAEGHSKCVEAKETQTELVLGTSTLCVKFVQPVPDSCCHFVEQPSNITNIDSLLLESQNAPVMVVASSILPAAVANGDSVASPVNPFNSVNENPFPIAVTATQATNTYTNPLQVCEAELPSTTMGANQGVYRCEQCKETFLSQEQLLGHDKCHRQLFKCDLCSATFARIGNYTRHRKIHNVQSEGQNTYRCNDCGREFLQRCDLKRHLLIHTKQEPHRCQDCGKGYIRRSDLIVHMRFHNNDKAFSCSLCDKKFFQTGDLSRHLRRAHMPNSQLTCGHCKKKYACESTMIRHMKAVHKDIIFQRVVQNVEETHQNSSDPSANAKDVLLTMTETTSMKK